jgi:glucose-6-phosphate isomerase
MLLTQLATGLLEGKDVVEVRKTVGDLIGYWGDDEAAKARADELLYVTQTWFPHPDGTEGAVLWGNTVLYPGRVGEERFMTRGHWHKKQTHGELVVTVSGQGLLLLMDADRNQIEVEMTPGSTHHIDGIYAHRTVNTGDEPLVFLCAWPADCGHEYDAILKDGFARRIG